MANDVGRLSGPVAALLVCLLDGPKHGYAISDHIEQVTGRRPGPGTLYGAIGRLEERGLIEALAIDGRRKPYALTQLGEQEARAELSRLAAIVDDGRRRLRLAESRA